MKRSCSISSLGCSTPNSSDCFCPVLKELDGDIAFSPPFLFILMWEFFVKRMLVPLPNIVVVVFGLFSPLLRKFDAILSEITLTLFRSFSIFSQKETSSFSNVCQREHVNPHSSFIKGSLMPSQLSFLLFFSFST